MPYSNLEAELKRKKINNCKLAEMLNISSNTISRKMKGTTKWNIDEINSIKELFDNQHSFEYLFKEV